MTTMDARRRTARVLVWAGVVLGVVVVLAVAALVYTGRPEFCRSCHIMEPRYVSWHRSVHAGKADCLDCHAQPGTIGEIRAHLEGARYLYVLATGREQVILQAEIPQGTCVKCHPLESLPAESGRTDIAHRAHYQAKVECVTCHKGFHNDLGGGRLKADLSNCVDCHPPSFVRRGPK